MTVAETTMTRDDFVDAVTLMIVAQCSDGRKYRASWEQREWRVAWCRIVVGGTERPVWLFADKPYYRVQKFFRDPRLLAAFAWDSLGHKTLPTMEPD